MKYNVRLEAVVAVKVVGVEAASQEQAIESALETTNLHHMFDRSSNEKGEYIEYTDEIAAALVDEENDDEFVNSKWYKPSGDAWLPLDWGKGSK